MNDKNLAGPWVRRFLLEHLVTERNLARNTQASYRDTLTLLLPFASTHGHRAIDRMTVEDLTPAIVRQFLDYLERDRHCNGVTRNQRLATIHSLARFIGMRSPIHVAWCSEIRSIPFKKTAKTLIGYLEKTEIDALLNQPDRATVMGARDHAVMLFLYNSGARADEAARLTVGNLQLGTSPSVRILGKGNKLRICPLWAGTSSLLSRMTAGRDASDQVFSGRTGQPLTRFIDQIRHTSPCHTQCQIGGHVGAVAHSQTSQSSHHPTHHRSSLATRRCRHQHNPGVVGACLIGHDPRLRGG
jgi:integrase/recombinase XerD